MNEDHKYLEEYIGQHLKEWNEVQKHLWLKMVAFNKVEKNDTKTLIDFSQWFDDFFLDYERYPTFEEVEKYFLGENNEV
jgi:hypothetical protein